MDILLKLPVVTSLSDIRRIRYIYDKIESSVRGLQGLGINPDSYGNLLIPIMLSKLPDELHLIISRKLCVEYRLTSARDWCGTGSKRASCTSDI